MLIAEFAETTGLTRDAVRFYVKHGLLRPSVSTSGNRYQHFDEADIERVILIQSGQSLGFTIRQIKGFSEEFESGKMDQARQIAVLSEQLAALEQQARMVNAMRGYLKKKIAWMKGGEVGPAPKLKGKTSARLQQSVEQVDCLHAAGHGLLNADKQSASKIRSRAMIQPREAARG